MKTSPKPRAPYLPSTLGLEGRLTAVNCLRIYYVEGRAGLHQRERRKSLRDTCLKLIFLEVGDDGQDARF